ncbi:hypothetical protein Fmac_032293 [Flemingia macrophylla]|uniref:Uncharacterized protein n=1 Tax=Flemingia macrophylla TaxID=520843 RepID=A0ABD1L4I4_9FABA
MSDFVGSLPESVQMKTTHAKKPWVEESFAQVIEILGMLVFVDDDTSSFSSLNYARVLIRTTELTELHSEQTANPRRQRVDLQREEEEYSERLTAISIFRRSSSLRCRRARGPKSAGLISGALGGFGAERCSLDASLNSLGGF